MYGLKTGYFTLNPKQEYKVFFVRKEEADKFVEYIRGIISSGRVPKAVVYGVFGLGKTHFLHYILYKLNDVSSSVYVETPPCHRRTKFTELYGSILRRMGGRYVLGLLNRAIDTLQPKGISLSEHLKLDPDLAYTIEETARGKEQHTLWRYLTGAKLRSAEVRSIGAMTNQLNEDEAVSFLNAIALLIKEFEGKQLMLLVDEIENTNDIGGDSLSMFREAIRGLVDESSRVGTIFAATGRAMEGLPICITDESVRRRIGFPNYMYFEEYTVDNLAQFIYEVIQYRRREDFDVKVAVKQAKEIHAESVTEKSYPFTEEGIKKIIETVVALRDTGKIPAVRPPEALSIMDRALVVATERSATLVTYEIIDEVCKTLTGIMEAW